MNSFFKLTTLLCLTFTTADMSCRETKDMYQGENCCAGAGLNDDVVVPGCRAGQRSAPHVTVIYHADLPDDVTNEEYNTALDGINQMIPSSSTDLISSSMTVGRSQCDLCSLRNLHYSFRTASDTIQYYGGLASPGAAPIRKSLFTVLHIKKIEVIGTAEDVEAIEGAMASVIKVFQDTQTEVNQTDVLSVHYLEINADRIAFDTRC